MYIMTYLIQIVCYGYYILPSLLCVHTWCVRVVVVVAVRAYMVHEGGCGCCVRACVRVGMGMRMRRLARS